VDDLDRINPQDAVAILELLKNIFSVPNCVFILAIDYQVVVKGLEGKFGIMKPENEWEFRAFFDKIIQLPFTMPMGQYNIGNYVNSLLIKVGFIKEAFEDENLKRIIEWTIGGNPRSIKRLINSISLIKIFSSEKKQTEDDQSETKITEDEEKLLLFSLLCLQIAYPRFYDLLQKEPNITAWDDDFAFAETMREEEKKEQFAKEFDAAKKKNDFKQPWERTLYRICYTDSRL
jgi:KAP family P-loop domain.